jgi:quercetin dioxygenase-like cupin family protein
MILRITTKEDKTIVNISSFSMAYVLSREDCVNNDAYRKVVYTDKNQQYVLMALSPSQNIGAEAHQQSQTVIVFDGKGTAILGAKNKKTDLTSGTTILVNGGTQHDFIADPNSWLRLLVIYSPPKHPKDLIQFHRQKSPEPTEEIEETEAEEEVKEETAEEEKEAEEEAEEDEEEAEEEEEERY